MATQILWESGESVNIPWEKGQAQPGQQTHNTVKYGAPHRLSQG